jgi:TfoX/Sxy family transcriptional regulator of competence genes
VPVDEEIVDRVDGWLGDRDGISRRRMFGGVAWMLDGNMAVGALATDLLVRLGADGAEAALREPGVRPMDFTGRVMKAYVFVDAAALDAASLGAWIERGLAFAATLPPKTSDD